MLLAIAQKSYIKNNLKGIKEAIQAFEAHNKPRAISALHGAYGLLPRSQEGLKIGVDIVESLTQLRAYDEALEVIQDLEQAYGLELLNDKPQVRFYFFRAFANAAEAHEASNRSGQASRYRKLALDQLLEIDEQVDLEMLQLFSPE